METSGLIPPFFPPSPSLTPFVHLPIPGLPAHPFPPWPTAASFTYTLPPSLPPSSSCLPSGPLESRRRLAWRWTASAWAERQVVLFNLEERDQFIQALCVCVCVCMYVCMREREREREREVWESNHRYFFFIFTRFFPLPLLICFLSLPPYFLPPIPHPPSLSPPRDVRLTGLLLLLLLLLSLSRGRDECCNKWMPLQ